MKGILQKCIEELKKPKPNKDYVLGMLETLMEIGVTPVVRPFVDHTVVRDTVTAPRAVKAPAAKPPPDPEGDLETPEARAERLSKAGRVPLKLLGLGDVSMKPPEQG